jgi:DNA polymerase-3 subunit delta'
MLFADIIGQDEIKNRLILSVKEQRISHAQVFYGKEGVGKLPLAIAYAQYICCEQRTDNDACGTCPSCVKFAKLIHPDLHFVFPVIKPENKKTVICDDFIAQFRAFILQNPYFREQSWYEFIGSSGKQGLIYSNESEEIIKKLSLKTYESEFKIMIIYQPEKMHTTCANKLLKIIEEPPAKTLFILVSEDPDTIISTIQSRTQRLLVPPIENYHMIEALQNNCNLSEQEAQNIARIANGNYIAALEAIASSDDTRENFNRFISVMRLAWEASSSDKNKKYDSLKALRKWTDELAKIGREGQKDFLMYAQRMIRESFIFNLQCADLNYLTGEEKAFFTKFSPFVNEKNIEKLMQEFQLAQRHIEQNVQAKMVFFDLSLKIILLLKI